MDWMVEVTTSFKCFERTYYTAMTIMDKFLIASHQHKTELSDKDVLSIGIVSLYLASKFNDIHPIHSQIVAEKISHGTKTKSEIIADEEHYLKVLGARVDFVTPFDFHEAYIGVIANNISVSLSGLKGDQIFYGFCNEMITPLSNMTLYLVKMVIQCNDFQSYSYSVQALACIYAANAFIKHSKSYRGESSVRFNKLVN